VGVKPDFQNLLLSEKTGGVVPSFTNHLLLPSILKKCIQAPAGIGRSVLSFANTYNKPDCSLRCRSCPQQWEKEAQSLHKMPLTSQSSSSRGKSMAVP